MEYEKELDYVVDEQGCWIFAGCKDKSGYGIITYRKQNYRAHRYMFLKHKGPIVEGLVIRHTCNTPSCINPSHLLLGTQAQNMQDKVESKIQFCAGRHELTYNNSYKWNNRLICKICKAKISAQVAAKEKEIL